MKLEEGKKEEIQESKDDQEEIDNSALIVRLYNQDPCIPVANFFTINLPIDCTMDVRA